jgi:hypothetical protein
MIIVAKVCAECPFCQKKEDIWECKVSTPKERPVADLPERPSFCPLRREKVIVQEPSK